MKRKKILSAAAKATSKDRESVYGPPEINFLNIAGYWENYLSSLGVPIPADGLLEPEDVAWMLTLVKVARAVGPTYSPDNAIDAAGYAALAGELGATNDQR